MKFKDGARDGKRLRRIRAFQLESLERRALLSARSIANPALPSTTTADVSATAAAAPMPTAREVARQYYSGTFQGTYLIGPGRYTDQAASIRIDASGHSNQSYNANMQMILLTPNDQVNGQTTGAANIAARNVATSGTTLIINITAAPTGRGGLPTTGTWTVSGSSGGAYSGAGPFGDGSGTVTIRYVPTGNVPKGARGTGRVAVVLHGEINTSGVTNPVFGPANTPVKP